MNIRFGISIIVTGVTPLKKTNKERLQDLMAYVDRLTHIEPGEIPDIQLYMDQVTTFMNERLAGTRFLLDGLLCRHVLVCWLALP